MSGAQSYASKVAAGLFDPAVLAWLKKGFAAHNNAGGAVPLERCLSMGTSKKRSRVARDAWLLKAWHQMTETPAGRARSNALAAELRHFEVTFWAKWKHFAAPPDGTSALRMSLFQAAKTGAPLITSGRMMHIICCERFGKFLLDDISNQPADNETINHERKNECSTF